MNDDDVMLTVTIKLRRDGKINFWQDFSAEIPEQTKSVLALGAIQMSLHAYGLHIKNLTPSPA